jgi:hypothetical protein
MLLEEGVEKPTAVGAADGAKPGRVWIRSPRFVQPHQPTKYIIALALHSNLNYIHLKDYPYHIRPQTHENRLSRPLWHT